MNITGMFHSLAARLKSQIGNLSTWVSAKVKPEAFLLPKDVTEEVLKDEEIVENATTSLYSLHLNLSLLYFLITDFINQ